MKKKRKWKIKVQRLKCYVKFVSILTKLVEIVTSKENHNVECARGSVILEKM